MRRINVVRAWKDPYYRARLAGETPPNPAGLVEVSDAALKEASGLHTQALTTAPTCTEFTSAKHRCCPKP